MTKKKFKDTKIGGLLRGLVREGLQSVPFVGTLVTNFKEDTTENPKGKIKLTKWDGYRLVIGLVIGVALAKGLMTEDQITFVMSFIGWN